MTAVKIFRFQKLSFLDYKTEKEIVNFEAVATAKFSLKANYAEQMSGNSLVPIETEIASMATEGSITIGEYGPEVLEAIAGAAVTKHDTTAGLLNEERTNNAKFFGAGNKVITALALSTTTSDIETGFFRVEVSNATAKKIKVYAIVSPTLKVDQYENYSTGQIGAEITLQDGVDVDLGMGVTAEVAASVDFADVNTGDYFTFRSYAVGKEAFTAKVGQKTLTIPKIKILCASQSLSDGRWSEVFIYNALFSGLDLSFGDEFSSTEVQGKLIYDPIHQGVYEFRAADA